MQLFHHHPGKTLEYNRIIIQNKCIIIHKSDLYLLFFPVICREEERQKLTIPKNKRILTYNLLRKRSRFRKIFIVLLRNC